MVERRAGAGTEDSAEGDVPTNVRAAGALPVISQRTTDPIGIPKTPPPPAHGYSAGFWAGPTI